MTLIEVVITSLTITVVLFGTLAAFQAFSGRADAVDRVAKAQEVARLAMDRMVRDLRNAAPTTGTSTPVLRNGATDLVVLTDHPGQGQPSGSFRRVRYCLQTPSPGAALWAQVAPAGQATLPATSCPDSAWGTRTRIAGDLANQDAGVNRTLLTYDAAAAAEVRSIRIALAVDPDPTRPPGVVVLESAAYLRNRDLTPPAATTSDFSASCSGSGQALLSTALTVDDGGDPLTATYTDNGVTIGTGTSLSHKMAPGAHTLTLTLTDVLGLATTLTRSLTC